MKQSLILLLVAAFSQQVCFGQDSALKEKAKKEFSSKHYDAAIGLLNQAADKTPEDPELYYLLGYYSHYRAYDSRPLVGYNAEYSNSIFRYLDKALSLNPDYGDARYFYGAECSANAFNYMQRYQADSLKRIYKKAYDKGAYPVWLIEFGKNILNACNPDAILFAGGNSDFDVCMYLQLHENFRTDITIIPIGFIDRPWYVNFLKNGLPGAVRKIQTGLTEEQILNMHPYKWDTTSVSIPISQTLTSQYNLPENHEMEWLVCPDLVSLQLEDRDRPGKRTFLSPQRAVLVQIVEANIGERPIFFSNGADNTFLGGLDEYLQNCGLVSRLLPFKTKNSAWSADMACLENLVLNCDYSSFSDILKTNFPRISGITFLYHRAFVSLALRYKEKGDSKGLGSVLKAFEKHMRIGFNKEMEDSYYQYIRKL